MRRLLGRVDVMSAVPVPVRRLQWLNHFGIAGGAKLAVAIQDLPCAQFPGAPMKLRGLVATAPVRSGEVLLVVPDAVVPTGEMAVGQLSRSLQAVPEGLQRLLRRPVEFDKLSVPPPFVDRDSTALVVLLARTKLFNEIRNLQGPASTAAKDVADARRNVGSRSPFDLWVDSMPKGTPPLAATLKHVHDVVLQRGDSATTRESGDGDADSRPLVERFNLGADGEYDVPSRAILQPLRLAAQPSAAQHHRDRPWPRHHVSLQDIAELEEAMRAWTQRLAAALAPSVDASIARVLVAQGSAAQSQHQHPDDALLAHLGRCVTWAHFMVRSRAVAVGPGYDRPVLLPVVDMINHRREGNVTVAQATADNASAFSDSNMEGGSFVLRAAAPIAAGEAIVMNYGDHAARVRYALGANKRAAAVGSAAQRRAPDATAAETESATRNDKRFFGGADGVVSNKLDSDLLRSTQQHAAKFAAAVTDAQRQLAFEKLGVLEDELAWAWSYGFVKPGDDREHEKQLLWRNRLKSRVQAMVDPHRRGRPGEFCVGVPPGVEHLRDARRRVEAVHYQGQAVFPRQAQ
jgi:hypothetical protein